MGITTGVVLPCLLVALAGWLGRREWRLYRAPATDGTDLFVYSRGRLVRRMIGLVALAAIGVTLAVIELAAASAAVVTGCGALLVAELLVLVVVPVLDLRETARTAHPERLERAGMTRRQIEQIVHGDRKD